MKRRVISGLSVLFCWLPGCASQSGLGPVPVGPGAATDQDLSPWLVNATAISRFGLLSEFNVASPLGSYDTWGLATADPQQSLEVDVRDCRAYADQLRGRHVKIEGHLLERGNRHMSLLVASKITAVDEAGNPLPLFVLVGHAASEPDPVSGQFDPVIVFNPTAPQPALAANQNAGTP